MVAPSAHIPAQPAKFRRISRAQGLSFTEPDEEWVIKESRFSDWSSRETEYEFHRKALITQKAAEALATKFNEEAAKRGLVNLPKVAYMNCCLVEVGRIRRGAGEEPDPKEPAGRLLFAERRVRGTFRKWNTNFGTVVATAPPPESEEPRSAELDAEIAAADETRQISSDDVPQVARSRRDCDHLDAIVSLLSRHDLGRTSRRRRSRTSRSPSPSARRRSSTDRAACRAGASCATCRAATSGAGKSTLYRAATSRNHYATSR